MYHALQQEDLGKSVKIRKHFKIGKINMLIKYKKGKKKKKQLINILNWKPTQNLVKQSLWAYHTKLLSTGMQNNYEALYIT